ncbi:MAG TPA: hypothetical protein PLB55_10760 [Prosthecobacter sp.]|nr:hypothetical protein [Prosthecobacter sp.]
MPVLEAIENEIKQLPRDEALELQDWLADYLDDKEELSPDFVAAIERGKSEIAQGLVRAVRTASS